MAAIRPFKLFGFRFGHFEEQEKAVDNTKSFVPPTNEDAAISYDVGTAATYHITYDFDSVMNDEANLINKYRDMAINAQVEPAINEVVNDLIVVDKQEPPVQLVIGDNKILSPELRKKILHEFTNILRLLNFQNNCYDIAKRWYVDGRLYYHIIIDQKNPQKGIQELRYVDPRQIKKFREVVKKRDTTTNVDLVEDVREYYVWNRMGFIASDAKNITGVRIHPDSIAHAHSGLLSPDNTIILSHLHKAIRPYNHLRHMEDSLVIYRMTRAPERRIFNVDVGDMPPVKAKEYLERIMTDYRTRMQYNPQTGELRDDRKHSSITEDFWFPKRGDGRNSEVTTLSGGQNLSEIDDVVYFQKNLYKALNIPITRLDPTTGFNLGKTAEISREEIKFSKFITQLRFKFNHIFDALLKRQLILKKITTEEDWEFIKESIYYDYLSDSHFAELKEIEMLNNRLDALAKANDFVAGEDKTYLSKEYVRRKILRLTDQEMEEIDKEIAGEGNIGEDKSEEQPEESSPEENAPIGKEVEEPPAEEAPEESEPPVEELPEPEESEK